MLRGARDNRSMIGFHVRSSAAFRTRIVHCVRSEKRHKRTNRHRLACFSSIRFSSRSATRIAILSLRVGRCIFPLDRQQRYTARIPSGSPAMTDRPIDAARVSRCTIVLVHGTWGRGPFPKRREASLYPPNKRWWFEEGSQFQTRLDKALKGASLDWRIRAFHWSGANSVQARDCAARELSKRLTEDLQDPDANAVIIAHSHGGNVALRALQRLDPVAGKIKLVTLATPFLRVFARRSFQLPLAAQILVYFAMVILMPTFSFALEISMLDLAVDNKWISEEQATRAFTLLDESALLFVVPGLIIARYLIAVLSRSRVAVAIEKDASYDTRGAAASRMLVIRGVNDEASLSLAAGSIASALSYFVLTWIFPGITLILIAALSLAAASFPLFPISDELIDWVDWAMIAFFGTSLCALIFLILPGCLSPFPLAESF
jgi:hypothetical protein